MELLYLKEKPSTTVEGFSFKGGVPPPLRSPSKEVVAIELLQNTAP